MTGTATVAGPAGRRADTGLDVVTGAFSYSGAAIAGRCTTADAGSAP